MGTQIKDARPTAPEPLEESSGPNRWKIVQFTLAAASAVPLLWVGGLNSWPWDHHTAAASAPAAANAADPVRLEIKSLNINAQLDPLAVDPATQALTPPTYGQAGWSQAGPVPGAVGRAVVEGHRTTQSGAPDVFSNLSDANTGDQITIVTAAGKTLQFRVTSVETFDISAVPTDRVFGTDGKTAQLRIIAPSGNASGNSYSEDVVVFADLAS